MRTFALRPSIIVSVVFSLVLTSGVSAATVTSVSGGVSLNRGSGFTRISSGTSASPGDLVMAGPSGHAVIVYADGCREKVEPGSVVTVADFASPCKTGYFTDDGLLLGAAVVIGGGVGIYFATQGHDHDHPASPN
jgi:hypothetical protein